MAYECYECGQVGHFQADCPNAAYVRPSVPRPYDSPVPAKREPTEPNEFYLAARDRLGIPSDLEAGLLLSVECPWCGAGERKMCVNPGTGERKAQAHDARYEAAGLIPPRNGAPQRLARQQAAEGRMGRLLI